MSELLEKILKIFIGECLGAIIFIMCLLVANTLPNDEISKQVTTLIVFCWAIYGIGTPIVVFAELEKGINNIFRRL